MNDLINMCFLFIVIICIICFFQNINYKKIITLISNSNNKY